MSTEPIIPTCWKRGDAIRDWACTRKATIAMLLDLRADLQEQINFGTWDRALSQKLDCIDVLLQET